LKRIATFPRARRLSGRKAFARVFGGRHSAGNRFLVIYAMPNELPFARLGLTVGRRIGNAVKRNSLKRIIREAFRLESSRLPIGFDLVCVPRPEVDLTLEDARRNIVSVAERAAARVNADRKS
jgi:ribonuclease P protein component